MCNTTNLENHYHLSILEQCLLSNSVLDGGIGSFFTFVAYYGVYISRITTIYYAKTIINSYLFKSLSKFISIWIVAHKCINACFQTKLITCYCYVT